MVWTLYVIIPSFNSSVGILSIGTGQIILSDAACLEFQFLGRNSVHWDVTVTDTRRYVPESFNSSVGILSIGTTVGMFGAQEGG